MKHELEIEGGGRLYQYRYFWLKFVQGFDPSTHCAKCLIGRSCKAVSNRLQGGSRTKLVGPKRFDFIYLCGVERTWLRNLHLACRPEKGEVAEAISADGDIKFRISNAVRVSISPLPKFWMGKGVSFTTCRNYQFGVQEYGATVRIPGQLDLDLIQDEDGMPLSVKNQAEVTERRWASE